MKNPILVGSLIGAGVLSIGVALQWAFNAELVDDRAKTSHKLGTGYIQPSNNGPSLAAQEVMAQEVLDLEPQPLVYIDAGEAGLPLAWSPATLGRYPRKILTTATGGAPGVGFNTVCVDMVGENGTVGVSDQCVPLADNVWHSMTVSRIYQQGDSGTVYVGY